MSNSHDNELSKGRIKTEEYWMDKVENTEWIDKVKNSESIK